jgi:two-component system response regulator AtoC
MSLPTQAKLLRFIDHRNFKRVGGAQDISVDIRIVAATNKNLDEEVRLGRFRSDLYFRLKVVSITLPPLRVRDGDVALLSEHFMREFSRKFQKGFAALSPEASHVLEQYPWPGNVRELRNLIERVVLLEEGSGSRPTICRPRSSVAGSRQHPRPRPRCGTRSVCRRWRRSRWITSTRCSA